MDKLSKNKKIYKNKKIRQKIIFLFTNITENVIYVL